MRPRARGHARSGTAGIFSDALVRRQYAKLSDVLTAPALVPTSVTRTTNPSPPPSVAGAGSRRYFIIALIRSARTAHCLSIALFPVPIWRSRLPFSMRRVDHVMTQSAGTSATLIGTMDVPPALSATVSEKASIAGAVSASTADSSTS